MKKSNFIGLLLFMLFIWSNNFKVVTSAQIFGNLQLPFNLFSRPLESIIDLLNPLAAFLTPSYDSTESTHFESNPIFNQNPFRLQQGIPAHEDIHFQNHSAATFITPLYGSIFKTAYYFVDGLFGEGLQRQSLIIDTGSSVLAIACEGCKNCGTHLDQPYKCSDSKGCFQIPCSQNCDECNSPIQCSHCVEKCPICSLDRSSCGYDVHYTEGSSISGSWKIDTIRFPLQSESNKVSEPIITPFGCHQKETNLFLTQAASGIIGLQYYSSSGPRTFLHSALHTGNYENKIMSICFAEEGGLLALGGSLDEYHYTLDSNFSYPYTQWIARASQYRSYQVELISIQIENFPIISVSHRNNFFNVWGSKRLTTLDSGTTLSYFPSDVYNSLMSDFNLYLNRNRRLNSPSTTRGLDLQSFLSKNSTLELRHENSSSIDNFQFGKSNIMKISESKFDKITSTAAEPRRTQQVKYTKNQSPCWQLPNGDRDLKLFPVLKLHFSTNEDSSTIVEWYPESYLYSRGSPNYRCMSIESNHQILLGATFFINKDIIFDFENTNRIGLAQARCSSHKLNNRYN